MKFSLLQVSTTGLEALAVSRAPDGLEDRVEPGALPPAFVALRSLAYAAAGHSAPWSTTFLIVNNQSQRIVGGCGFKTVPASGRVEVGYGVAPAAQGMGAATAALDLLVQLAFDAGAGEVLAEVAPTNHASTRVVRKAGFAAIGARVDDDDEYVVQWTMRCHD